MKSSIFVSLLLVGSSFAAISKPATLRQLTRAEYVRRERFKRDSAHLPKKRNGPSNGIYPPCAAAGYEPGELRLKLGVEVVTNSLSLQDTPCTTTVTFMDMM